MIQVIELNTPRHCDFDDHSDVRNDARDVAVAATAALVVLVLVAPIASQTLARQTTMSDCDYIKPEQTEMTWLSVNLC